MKITIIALLVGVCALATALPHTETVYDVVNGKIKIADKVFLERNKNILRLLMHVHQPNTFIDQVQLGKTLDIESDISVLFTNPIVVKEFVRLYRVGLLPRGEIFTVLNEVHRRQVIALFHVFYYAKDWDTFYKCLCWARDHVNEGMFVYALTVAVLHRTDCKGIILPAPYEIYPNYFINGRIIAKAKEFKLQNFAMFKPEVLKRLMKDDVLINKMHLLKDRKIDTGILMNMGDNWEETKHFMPGHMDMIRDDYLRTIKDRVLDDTLLVDDKVKTWDDSTETLKTLRKMGKPYSTLTHMDRLTHGAIGKTIDNVRTIIIPTNYTGWYLNVDKDQMLTYFTEDIGLNSYYYYFHTDYPFWMGGSQFGLNKDRRGELYFYFHQQLLARYFLERLSNGLGKIDLIDLKKPIKTQFVCTLVYGNGIPFPMRPKNTDIIFDDWTLLTAEKIKILEKRILDAIDSGIVITETGEKVRLYTENGINVLGNLIQGNKDSVHRRFYGFLTIYAKMLLGFSGKAVNDYRLHPSALELYTTAMRDPVFYSIYKRVVYYFLYYKKNLPTYTYSDLVLPGVKVENVVVDKLITYFDYFDVELYNAIFTDFTKETDPTVIVKARQMRLNHKPFTTRINVISDKTTKVVVRLFLGPKYDVKGHIININDNRVNFVELDKFVWELKLGKNVIERNSRMARGTVMDRTSYYTLYKKMMLALQGVEDFVLDQTESHCGFPNRLLLPKGKKGGMVFQLFVMITPFTGIQDDLITVRDEKLMTCGVGTGERFLDNLPLGFPLDRKIDVTQFFVPNMYFKDVTIFHKRLEDVLDMKTVDKMIDMTMHHV